MNSEKLQGCQAQGAVDPLADAMETVAGLIGAARSASLDTATPLASLSAARRLAVSGGARAGSTTRGHAGTPGGA